MTSVDSVAAGWVPEGTVTAVRVAAMASSFRIGFTSVSRPAGYRARPKVSASSMFSVLRMLFWSCVYEDASGCESCTHDTAHSVTSGFAIVG